MSFVSVTINGTRASACWTLLFLWWNWWAIAAFNNLTTTTINLYFTKFLPWKGISRLKYAGKQCWYDTQQVLEVFFFYVKFVEIWIFANVSIDMVLKFHSFRGPLAKSFTFVPQIVTPARFDVDFCILRRAILRATSVIDETFTSLLFLIIRRPKVARAESLGRSRFGTDGSAI